MRGLEKSQKEVHGAAQSRSWGDVEEKKWKKKKVERKGCACWEKALVTYKA